MISVDTYRKWNYPGIQLILTFLRHCTHRVNIVFLFVMFFSYFSANYSYTIEHRVKRRVLLKNVCCPVRSIINHVCKSLRHAILVAIMTSKWLSIPIFSSYGIFKLICSYTYSTFDAFSNVTKLSLLTAIVLETLTNPVFLKFQRLKNLKIVLNPKILTALNLMILQFHDFAISNDFFLSSLATLFCVIFDFPVFLRLL